MIQVISGQTADDVWKKASDLFLKEGLASTQLGRGGETQELLHIGLSIEDPKQRWIVSRNPSINLAFALAEVVWIICGRNDSAFLNYWNRQLPKFAGEGPVYHGAYGHRLRYSLGIDQLDKAFYALKANPNSRQIVLQIWDSSLDLPGHSGKPVSEDIPCNIVSVLKVRENKLEWMQLIRSNDLFLGLPHNFIQFTYLQEIIAGWLNCEMGSFNQISDSLHVYKRDIEKIKNSRIVKPKLNNDSISYNKKLSDRCFSELSNRMDLFVKESISKEEHESISEWEDAPQPFKNILCVIAAEAARKRKWKGLAEEIISNCTNPSLIQIWDHWLQRVEVAK